MLLFIVFIASVLCCLYMFAMESASIEARIVKHVSRKIMYDM